MIYCPYSDADIPLEEAADEHVIPLALGGANGLTIPVSRSANSQLGTEIDGVLANEFLVHRARVKEDVRGHSGREPVLRFKNARDKKTGRPLSVTWGKRLEIYDPIEQRRRTESVAFEMKFKLDPDIRLRFLAKCFLSAGYLVYGDFFRRAVKHGDPRLLMRGRLGLSATENASIRTRYFAWLERDGLVGKQLEEFETQMHISAAVKGSMLVFMPGPANLGIFGSILGLYLGMLNVPADMTDFPRFDEAQDLGHAIIVQNGRVLRWSHRRLLARVLQEFEKSGCMPDDPGGV